MKNIANTKENNARVAALKKINECHWGMDVIHDTLDKCLRVINLNSFNSGWYNPTAIVIEGVNGIFMINQDGSIYFELRIIKEDEKKFRVEYMSDIAYKEFEKYYLEYLNN